MFQRVRSSAPKHRPQRSLGRRQLRSALVRQTFKPHFESLEMRTLLATVTVTGNGDTVAVDGLVTLREAMLSTNANAAINADVVAAGGYGTDTINFNIAGAGVQTITVLSALPALTDSVTINGYSQPGSSVNTNAFPAGSNAVLSIEIVEGTFELLSGASGSTIRGLVINGLSAGILVDNSDGNIFVGNFIGTNAAGIAATSTGGTGIAITNNATSNRIGGSAAADRNVISGNVTGVQLANAGSSNLIVGNIIGLGADGSTIVENQQYGIELLGLSQGTIIGGDDDDDGLLDGNIAGRNVISGNGLDGIFVANQAGNTTIRGNFIGTDITGNLARGNDRWGIQDFGSADLFVGGTTAGAGNVISDNGNAAYGEITGGGIITYGFQGTIQGNIIGLNAGGTAKLGAQRFGIEMRGDENTVGGPTVAARNIISGNEQMGLWIVGAGATLNVIQGNYIGTNLNGDAAIGNRNAGIGLNSAHSGNRIVGNVISGSLTGANLGTGIFNADTSGTIIQGNRIGTNALGTAALPNAAYGIATGGGTVVIGTDSDGNNDSHEGNLISGNDLGGIAVGGTANATLGTIIAGNTIGLNLAGTAALGNGSIGGILLRNTLPRTISGTRIGTDANGVNDEYERNVISGNFGPGIDIDSFSGTVSHNTISGNYIGTNVAGNLAIGNSRGIQLRDGTNNNTISRNVISGNSNAGVGIFGSSTQNNSIVGNWIGTDESGNSPLGNGLYGVLVDGAANNTIGAGNLISGNAGWGVWLTGGATLNRIESNLIGTNDVGTAALPNDGGVYVNASPNNTIGGTGANKGNVISGNSNAGIFVSQPASIDNRILGNTIGLQADLSSSVSNAGAGITLFQAVNTIIGGSGNSRNIISANQYGIDLFQASGTQIFGNWIGSDRSGSNPLGNALDGIVIEGGSNNTIGNPADGLGNVISGQGRDGIRASNSFGLVIESNLIGTDATGTLPLGNQGYGISLLAGTTGGQIGGDTLAKANVIGKNILGGIQLDNAGGSNVQVNFIGTDRSGALNLGNDGPGVVVANSTIPIAVGGVLPNRLNTIAFNDVGVRVNSSASQVALRGNSFSHNANLAIDLGGDGITANDDDDPDTGANHRQNYPQLLTVAAGASTQIIGSLESKPNATYNLDFYASSVADASGFGEGMRYLGNITVSTGSNGLAAINHALPSFTINGEFISAIATDSFGNTSEFSAVVGALSAELPTINPQNLILTELVEQDGYGTPTQIFNEGAVVRMDGLFANLDPTDAHTVRINWGDGTAEDIINVEPGPRGFTAEHIYADDRPSATNHDNYVINVFVTDDDNASGVASINVTVVNSPAQFDGPLTITPTALNEGQTATLTGSFVDPGADVHRLLIDWGDGAPVQLVPLPIGARTFSVPHVYRDDAQTVSVTLIDDDTVGSVLPDNRQLPIMVHNLAPTPSISAEPQGIEGTAYSLAGSVTDPGVGDLESFVWQMFRNGAMILEDHTSGRILAYTPEDDGEYTARLITTDDEGASGATEHAFTILNAAPEISLSSLSFNDSNGAILTTVIEGTPFSMSGMFADLGINDTHQITIDWGDNSPSTTLTLPRGARAFVADHIYPDDNPTGSGVDPYTIRIKATDNANQFGVVQRIVDVANLAPIAQIVDNGSDDTTIRLRASVTDQSNLDTFQYSWTIPGVTLPSTTATNLTTIEFARSLGTDLLSGFGQASVLVTDDDGGFDTATAVIAIGTNFDDLIDVNPAGANISITMQSGTTTNTAVFPPPETVVILGRDLNDRITVASSLSIQMSIDGGSGNDTITSSSGNDTITGSSGDDSVLSSAGHDVIDASLGNDTVDSGNGHDTIIINSFSDKYLIDGDGIDTLDFSGVSTPSIDSINGVSLDLSLTTGTLQTVRTGGGISLTGVYENVVGTPYKDLFVDNAANNLIFGGAGDDSIQSGAGGNDSLDGGSGHDSITGGSEDDLIFGGADNDTVQAGLGDDSIEAGDGDDLIFGGLNDGNDTISGGTGDDSIEGGKGDDLIFGGGDDDTIQGSTGDDSIDGGNGNDLIFGSPSDGNDTIEGGLGDDSIQGAEGDDLIFGGDGHDTISSGIGDESIVGGDGDDLIFGGLATDSDTIHGGLGDDSIVGGSGGGDDLIFGGDGNDTIQAGASDESILGGAGGDLIFGGSTGDDTILGGTGDDSIEAGQGDDLIFGGAGDDTIQAGLGNESIEGGSGDDLIFGGGLGVDTIHGGAGDDSINGGQGDDLIFGGDGDDSIVGGSGDESIEGGAGDDLIFGGSDVDVDTIRGGLGDDSITGGDGDDLIFGDAGDDSIAAGAGDESVDGGSGDDLIFGGTSVDVDTIRGGLGDDSITGGNGDDLIFGDSGDDTIRSGAGDESIEGGDGDDLIFGGIADDADTISGGLGDDSIEGGNGDDLIFGGSGDDTIQAGVGDESIDGGSGDDLIFGGSTDDDSLPGGTSDDSILGGDGDDLIFGGDGGRDTIDGGAGDDSIDGGTGDDLIFGGSGDDTITAGAGDESILGGDGDDLIFGGSTSDDSLPGGTSDDSIVGGDGDDLIFGGDAGNDTMDGGLGNDSITGGEGNDLIFGGDGHDTISASLGEDSIDGGAGDDLIFAEVPTTAMLTPTGLTVDGQGLSTHVGIEAAWLQGNADDNTILATTATFPVVLEGSGGDDWLDGGLADDVLMGGGGNDTLVGGGGDDAYRFIGELLGNDRIDEATGSGEDTLDFSGHAWGVSVNLGLPTPQAVSPGLTLTLVGAIENAWGTEYNDAFIGNTLDNKLFGVNGNDSLIGLEGNDTLSAGRRRVVHLDFDTASEVGEHVYTLAERTAIFDRMRADYAKFDIEFTLASPASGPFIRILFNAAVHNPLSSLVLGGISERVGWRELDGSGTAQVDVNSFLGTGVNKLPATPENVIALSSTIGSHELAHMYGLRHQDGFGSPGTGVFPGLNNRNRFRPVYSGPLSADETRFHLIGSPASIRTTLVDALGTPFFGERESLKLAFAESGHVVAELPNAAKTGSLLIDANTVPVQQLGTLPAISVPNTVEVGVNLTAGPTLPAAAIAVTGAIELASSSPTARSENDYYSFSGDAGDVVTIEVMSQILRHRIANPIDAILRVYDTAGQKLPYYGHALGAFNDDTFEPTDSILIDLILPSTGIFTVEVDTFSFSAPEFSSYVPDFDVAAFSLANPTHVAVTDRDTGTYELLIYRFSGTLPAIASGDSLSGGAGNDVLIGNSGKESLFGYSPGSDQLLDPSGGFISLSNPPVVSPIGTQYGVEGSLVSLTAASTDIDGDFRFWRLESVVGGVYPTGATIDPLTGVLQFTPGDNDTYSVRIVAEDFGGMVGSQVVTISVVNVAPTVSISGPTTTPLTGSPITVTSFASDPAGANDPLTYEWTVTRNGSPFSTHFGGTNYTFTALLSGTYVVGLTVNDGDGGVSTASPPVSIVLNNNAPAVAIETPVDGQFGIASQFTFRAADSDPADQSALFTYLIDWGDGSTQTVTGSRVRTVSHTYAVVSPTGLYTIRAWATDARGGISPPASAEFAVLGWTVLTDPIEPADTLLVIVGSQGNDDIRVKDKSGELLRVKINNRDESIQVKGTIYGDVDRMLIFGLSGNDTLRVDDDFDIPAEIWGGAGNDELIGGMLNDILMGGAGNDDLDGRGGRDVLVGGTGADTIRGGQHDDILIAGITAFEREFYQLAPAVFPAGIRLSFNDQRLALEAIMAEWGSERELVLRRTNLTGFGTGPRNNGNYFLKFHEASLSNTVFDDGEVDWLWGEAGSDWFLANFDGPTNLRDNMSDKSASEFNDDIDFW